MRAKSGAIKGVIWSGLDRFSSQGVQFIVQIILARLLAPSEFGIVAIASTINYIFQVINEQGFSTALMYVKDRTSKDYSTVFWSNIIIALISYIILFFSSPLISSFFNIEQLKTVIRIIGLNLFFQALYLVPSTIFTININFKVQAKATILSAVASGIIGIISAYYIRSVYAIVLQSLSYQIIYTIAIFILSSWRPTFEFSMQSFSKFFNYGYKLVLSRTINVLFEDLYTFGIGKVYSSTVLGFYNRANSFKTILSKNIIHVFQRVSMPMLCKEQESHENMKALLLKFICTSALIIFPLLAGLMVLREPLVVVLLTDTWIETANIILYTCPAGFMYLLCTFNRNLYNSTGRTDLALKTELIKKIIFLLIFIISIQYDFKVLLYSQIIIAFIELLIDSYVAGGLVGLNLFNELYALRKIIIATIFMVLCVSIYVHLISNVYLQLFGGFIIGLIAYIIICRLFSIITLRGLLRGEINFQHIL